MFQWHISRRHNASPFLDCDGFLVYYSFLYIWIFFDECFGGFLAIKEEYAGGGDGPVAVWGEGGGETACVEEGAGGFVLFREGDVAGAVGDAVGEDCRRVLVLCLCWVGWGRGE